MYRLEMLLSAAKRDSEISFMYKRNKKQINKNTFSYFFFQHASYDGNANGIPNDIGLVKLSSNADYTSYVQAVEYASSSDTFSSTDECFISGWGLDSRMFCFFSW